jgi:hypothetical protein
MRRDLSEANYTASACNWTTCTPGNRRLNRAPPAGELPTHRSPPCSRTVCRVKAKPRPRPLRLPAVTKGWKSLERISGRTPGPVSLDDDTVETVIYKNQEPCKELREGFRRSPPLMFSLDTNIIGPGDRWNQPARAYGFLLPRLGISSA